MQPLLCFFFFNDTATTEIYTLSLHDALPISRVEAAIIGNNTMQELIGVVDRDCFARLSVNRGRNEEDRKSTRLNSSHGYISYAVFCLKKKKDDRCIHLNEPKKTTTTRLDDQH